MLSIDGWGIEIPYLGNTLPMLYNECGAKLFVHLKASYFANKKNHNGIIFVLGRGGHGCRSYNVEQDVL